MSIFSKIKLSKPKRSLHNLSYPMKLSLGYGDLVPIMCEKIVPGDKFKHSHEFLLRMSPFVSQVYQSFDVRCEYFFVPSRILWNNFEKFLVENDPTLFIHPQISLSRLFDGQNTMENTLVDYIEGVSGHPRYDQDNVFHLDPIDGSSIGKSVDALPYAAIIKVFMDYYADENLFVRNWLGNDYDYMRLTELFDEMTTSNGSAYGQWVEDLCALINNAASSSNPQERFALFKRAYPKDYFTSALPWAQRGPVVQIPLNGNGDVEVYTTASGNRTAFQNVIATYESGSIPTEVQVKLRRSGDIAVSNYYPQSQGVTPVDGSSGQNRYLQESVYGPNASVQQSLDATRNAPEITFRATNINGTATITDLRTAMTVQAWLEKNARAGVRYKEQLASHFGVRSRDYRLDRAELLQSTKSHISIGEVFTTAANENSTFIPGLGVSTGTGTNAVKPFKHFFEEHGYLIGFMSVYPKAAYSQGMRRQRFELDKFDYYWPEFQHIGEQEIYNIELFVNDNSPEMNFATFGYTPRYAHYKTRNAEIHGDMVNTLNFMTASRQFTSVPRLNDDFISINPERDHLYRTFNAVTPYGNAKPVQVDFFHHCKALRPMSYFGSPRII